MLLTALAALALLASAPAASASSIAVQRDCADSDVFEQNHSRADLKRALKDIQGDVDEYTDCEKMILSALAGKASASGNSGGNGGGNSADLDGDGVVSPAERRVAAERAERERERRDRQLAAIDDELIDDGDEAGAGAGGGGSDDVPLPAILAAIALACAGIGGGLWYASKRNPAFANTLRRVPLPFRNS
jgi:hypothetical protein